MEEADQFNNNSSKSSGKPKGRKRPSTEKKVTISRHGAIIVRKVGASLSKLFNDQLLPGKSALCMGTLLLMLIGIVIIYGRIHGYSLSNFFSDDFVLPSFDFVPGEGLGKILIEVVFFSGLATLVKRIATVAVVTQQPDLNIIQYFVETTGELVSSPILTVMVIVFFSIFQIEFAKSVVISTETADFKFIVALSFLLGWHSEGLNPLLKRFYDLLRNLLRNLSSHIDDENENKKE